MMKINLFFLIWKIFNLSYGTKVIVNFLKYYPEIDFQFNEIKDEEFEKHLKLYEKDKNTFFSKNDKYFQKRNDNSKVPEYRNLLENFI